jgi:hypothetical protein
MALREGGEILFLQVLKNAIILFVPWNESSFPVFWESHHSCFSIGLLTLGYKLVPFENESADGNWEEAKEKVVSLELKSNFYGNSDRCDILLWLEWTHCLTYKHWHFTLANQILRDLSPSFKIGSKIEV